MAAFQNLDDLVLKLRTEGFAAGREKVKLLRGEMGKLVGANVRATRTGKQAADSTKAMARGAKEAQVGFLGLSDTLDKTIRKVALWTISTGVIFGTLRAIREGIGAIIEHDTQFTALRKVYSGAAEDLAGIRQEVLALSKDMKSLTQDAMEAAITVARTGRTRRDIISLTETALIAQNIAELDAADAVKFLNAASIQFNQDADQTLRILDEWNELSNRTPATTRDMAEAVSVAGSVFMQAGASIQFLNAQTAALVEITAKSGNVIGRAQRTMAIFSQRQSTVNKLAFIGVRVYDELLGTYRGIDTLLTDIASKWDGLTDAQKANIAQAIAGARQQQFFLALMNNQDIVLGNLVTQWESFGSAMRENEMFLESIAKRVDGLVNSLQRLAINLGEGGVGSAIKGIVQLLTDMVNALTEASVATNLLAAGTTALVLAFAPAASIALGIAAAIGIFVTSLTVLNNAIGTTASSTRRAQEEMDRFLKTSRDLTARSETINSMVDTLERLMQAGEEEKVRQVLQDISRMDVFGDLISGAETYEESIQALKAALIEFQKEARAAKISAIEVEIASIMLRKKPVFKTEFQKFVPGGIQVRTGFEFGKPSDEQRFQQLQEQLLELQKPRDKKKEGFEGFTPEERNQRMRNLKDEADILQMILDGRRQEDIIMARIAQLQKIISEGMTSDVDLQRMENNLLKQKIRLQQISIQFARQWRNIFERGMSGIIASGFEGDEVKRAMRGFTTSFGDMLAKQVTRGMEAALIAKGMSSILAGAATGGLAGLIAGGIGLLANELFGRPEGDERNTTAVDENTAQLRALNDNIRNLTSFMVNAPAGFITPPSPSTPLLGMQGAGAISSQVTIAPGAVVIQGSTNPAATAEAVVRKLAEVYGSGGHVPSVYGD